MKKKKIKIFNLIEIEIEYEQREENEDDLQVSPLSSIINGIMRFMVFSCFSFSYIFPGSLPRAGIAAAYVAYWLFDTYCISPDSEFAGQEDTYTTLRMFLILVALDLLFKL